MTFGYHPVGTPTCLRKQEVGKLCARAHSYVNDGLWKGWGFWVGTGNFDSLTRRASDVVEALMDTKANMACIQETQWKGSGFKFYGAKGKTYKLFWMGGEVRSDGVGVFVADKLVDSVVSVETHS